MAGSWYIDLYLANHLPRPGAEHQDAIGQVERFIHVMRDKQGRETTGIPQAQQLSLHGHARERVELAQRLVQQQQ